MRKTVFVLGAGASADFGLPLGSGLKERIVELVANEVAHAEVLEKLTTPFALACRQLGYSTAELIGASEVIRGGLQFNASIDDFLTAYSTRPEVVELGRLAIASAMCAAERLSQNHLHLSDPTVDGRRRGSSLIDTWLGHLFRRQRGTLAPDRVQEVLADASFIVFNYDRCLEQFLFWAFRDAFNLSDDDALAQVKRIPIPHVYGSLGPLPFEQNGGVAYGADDANLLTVAKGIKVYSEGIDDPALSATISGLMDEAEQVCFLGYAFHQQGLDVLFPNGARDNQILTGTAFGLNSESYNRVTSMNPHFVDFTGDRCLAYLQAKSAFLGL